MSGTHRAKIKGLQKKRSVILVCMLGNRHEKCRAVINMETKPVGGNALKFRGVVEWGGGVSRLTATVHRSC